MADKNFISTMEYLILLAILSNKNYTYGVPIYDAICKSMEKDVAMGAIYTSLKGLKNKGYIDEQLEEATKERGGRAKRFYWVTNLGKQAVKRFEDGIHRLKALETGIAGAGI